jgi:hypothetical protein
VLIQRKRRRWRQGAREGTMVSEWIHAREHTSTPSSTISREEAPAPQSPTARSTTWAAKLLFSSFLHSRNDLLVGRRLCDCKRGRGMGRGRAQCWVSHVAIVQIQRKPKRGQKRPPIAEGSCTHLRQSPHSRLRNPQELPFLFWLATEIRCGRAAPRAAPPQSSPSRPPSF